MLVIHPKVAWYSRSQRYKTKTAAMSSSKRFFKFILCSTLHDHKLRIPDMFVKKYGEQLSDSAKLIGPTGSICCVGVEKTDNKVWLHKRLHKFMEDHSVGFGYVLLFKYNGNSTFKVHIFDLLGSEVEYPNGGDSAKPNDANQLITRSGDVNQCITRFDDVNQLTIRSDNVNQFITRSDDVDQLITRYDEVNQLTARCEEVNRLTARCDDMPQLTARCDDVPQLTERCDNVPQLTAKCDEVNQLTARCDDVPQLTTRCDDVPQLTARCNDANLPLKTGQGKDDDCHHDKNDDDSSIEVLGSSADLQLLGKSAESSELVSGKKRRHVVSAETWKPKRCYLTRSEKNKIQDKGGIVATGIHDSIPPRNIAYRTRNSLREVFAGAAEQGSLHKANRKIKSSTNKGSPVKCKSVCSRISRNVQKSK